MDPTQPGTAIGLGPAQLAFIKLTTYAINALKNQRVIARHTATTRNHHLEPRIAAIVGNRIEAAKTPHQTDRPYGLSRRSDSVGKRLAANQEMKSRTGPNIPSTVVVRLGFIVLPHSQILEIKTKSDLSGAIAGVFGGCGEG